MFKDLDPILFRECLWSPYSPDIHKTKVQLHIEVAVQPRVRIRYDADYGVFKSFLDPVKFLKDKEVCPNDLALVKALFVEVNSTLQRAVRLHKKALKPGGNQKRFH